MGFTITLQPESEEQNCELKMKSSTIQTIKDNLVGIRAGFMLAWLLYSYLVFREDPENRYEGQYFFDYVSNANEFCCAVWAVVTLFARHSTNKRLLFWEKWLSAQTATGSWLIALVYWVMMETTDKTFHSFWQHGILGIVTSLDFLAREPFAFKWIFAPVLYCGLNVLYLFTIANLWPEYRSTMYSFTDYGPLGSDQMWSVLKLQSALTFLIQPSIFSALWTLQHIVSAIRRRVSKNEYVMTSDSDQELIKT
ncbi:unnamed protein product [Oikopleura dioica]|uniref:Uncharacterized protein n=1 Tax=Oikopleura dioica TaxID=34765 RepID=E4YJ07_OIKDI|nr:unnamed protein product [Oikopleura dioica]